MCIAREEIKQTEVETMEEESQEKQNSNGFRSIETLHQRESAASRDQKESERNQWNENIVAIENDTMTHKYNRQFPSLQPEGGRERRNGNEKQEQRN